MNTIELKDITEFVKAMHDRNSFLVFDEIGLRPAFTKEISKLILLMEWPMFTEKTPAWLRCYVAIMPHGKMSVAEIFFISCKKEDEHRGNYLGTHGVFSLTYPNEKHEYDPQWDDFISESLAGKIGLQTESQAELQAESSGCGSGKACCSETERYESIQK